MRWHWQNLNEHPGGAHGAGWRAGRAWLYLGRYTLGWEWYFFRGPECRAYVAVHSDPEGTLGASIALPWLCALYVHLDCPWGYRLAWLTRRRPNGSKYGTRREFGLAVHDRALWWTVWSDTEEWSSGDWRWMDGSWYPVDTLLGRNQVTWRDLDTCKVIVPMPERGYPATAVVKERIDQRPRWFARRRQEVWLEIPNGGIPFPGKGENSYDCGMDGLCGTGGRTVEEAIGNAVASALTSRRRYGGAGWQPATGVAP